MPHFDPPAFARHGLATAVFSCLIALALTLSRRGAWDVQLVYSLSIGLTSWLAIELGRLWLGGTDDIPWPVGWRGVALVVCGIGAGFVLGSAIGDAYSGSTQGGLLQRHDAVSTLVITVVASTAISFFFYSRGKAAHLQARMAQAQRDATEARLKLLEAQLEPHMMFNTLANLRVLIATDPPRAQAMLDHLIAYLRATLGGARATLHPLADEFARLTDYLELLAVRMGPAWATRWSCPTPCARCPCPRCCCNRWSRTPSATGWSPRCRAVTSPCAPAPAPARMATRCWCWRCTTPARACRRQHPKHPARALAWPRCASAWPRCMARTALLN